jgi:hypothetical protein
MKRRNILKTQEDILSELEDMNNSQIDYSDLPPMTEEERKTAQLYFKDFLDKLPPEMVKELIKRRLSETRVSETTENQVSG